MVILILELQIEFLLQDVFHWFKVLPTILNDNYFSWLIIRLMSLNVFFDSKPLNCPFNYNISLKNVFS